MREPCTSLFIEWFENFTVIVVDVEEVFSLSVGGLEGQLLVIL